MYKLKCDACLTPTSGFLFAGVSFVMQIGISLKFEETPQFTVNPAKYRRCWAKSPRRRRKVWTERFQAFCQYFCYWDLHVTAECSLMASIKTHLFLILLANTLSLKLSTAPCCYCFDLVFNSVRVSILIRALNAPPLCAIAPFIQCKNDNKTERLSLDDAKQNIH